MADKIWTFETLTAADGATLENILLTGKPPDWEQLNGYIYNGWNHEAVSRRISGEKFKKGFLKKPDGKVHGYNELVDQDNTGLQGEWKTHLENGKPTHLGYFRIAMVKDEPPQKLFRPYMHLGYFDYNVPENVWTTTTFLRVVKDFIVLPNPGDHTLLLCKAYLNVFPWLNIFYCYFMLGRREPIKYKPW